MLEKVFLVPFYAPIISYSLGGAGGIPGGGGQGEDGKNCRGFVSKCLVPEEN